MMVKGALRYDNEENKVKIAELGGIEAIPPVAKKNGKNEKL